MSANALATGPDRRVGTPRDTSIDAIRAVAIVGVVLGHWLVTALVLTPDGGLRQESPLRSLPWLTPATWVLQTLGLFFFAGGFAAARSHASARARGERYTSWLGGRLRRLARPTAALGWTWGPALLVATAAGAPYATVRTVATLVVSPLWFLVALAALTALTGPLQTAARRWGSAAALPAIAIVAVADAGASVLPVTLVAAWSVPYLLGVLAADGRLDGRRTGAVLALGGAVAVAALVMVAGYPASAVGVPGSGSNLNPPSLVAVGLAVAQTGVAVLLRPWLRRLLRRPAPLSSVMAVNVGAMTIFLWHQSVLIVVSLTSAWVARGGPLPGLHSAPDGASWLAARVAWLPLLVAILAVLVWADGAKVLRRAGVR